MIYYILLASIVMYAIGFILGRSSTRKKIVGTLRIDQSDPDDGPYLFLELSTDPRGLVNEKQVVLNVNPESYLTQK